MLFLGVGVASVFFFEQNCGGDPHSIENQFYKWTEVQGKSV